MNMKEVEKTDCPRHVLRKLERSGIDSFSESHFTKLDLKSHIDWIALGKHADDLYYKNHPEKMFFGKKLKELRLKHAKMGLRNFSIATGMLPSEYSNIERGLAPPPEDNKWFNKLCKKLKVPSHSEVKLELYNEWKKPFVMQLMDEDISIGHALMTDGTSADAEKLGEVSEYMQNIAKEHNKKAREYNGSKRKDSGDSREG